MHSHIMFSGSYFSIDVVCDGKLPIIRTGKDQVTRITPLNCVNTTIVNSKLSVQAQVLQGPLTIYKKQK